MSSSGGTSAIAHKYRRTGLRKQRRFRDCSEGLWNGPQTAFREISMRFWTLVGSAGIANSGPEPCSSLFGVTKPTPWARARMFGGSWCPAESCPPQNRILKPVFVFFLFFRTSWLSGFFSRSCASGFHAKALAGTDGFTPKSQTEIRAFFAEHLGDGIFAGGRG